MTVNQTLAHMEVVQMELVHTDVHVMQVIMEQFVLKVQTSFNYLFGLQTTAAMLN